MITKRKINFKKSAYFVVLIVCTILSFMLTGNAYGASSQTFYTHPGAQPNHKIMVILVSFNDQPLTYSDAQWNNLYFGTSGSTIRNYYDEVSGGKVIFGPVTESSGTANDGVVRIHMNRNHPGAYGNSMNSVITELEQMLTSIMPQVDSIVNFALLDKNGDGILSKEELLLALVFAGYEGDEYNGPYPYVYPFKMKGLGITLDNVVIPNDKYFSMAEMYNDHMATIGTPCHEIGHIFGLPDLYDADHQYQSFGVGIHSLMGTGCQGYIDGQNMGETPVHFDAWSKVLLGYVTPTVVNYKSGYYTVNSFNSPSGYNVLRINTSNPKEYFLVENRQFNGFDTGLKKLFKYEKGGIAIWHIDENAPNNNNKAHKKVDLEEANEGILGKSQLDTHDNSFNYDHYFSTDRGLNLFNSTSIPNSKLYDGSDSGIQINVTSSSADSMTVHITSPLIYTKPEEKYPVIDSFSASATVIRSGSVNVRAIVSDNGYGISQVIFSMTKQGTPVSTEISSKYIGNNTWEATINPAVQGEGDYLFGVKVTNTLGNITRWKGKGVNVTVDPNAPNLNLALGKPATCSRELSYQLAGNALNGTSYEDTNSLSDKWCTGIGYGNNSWLRVDLGSAQTINRWKVIHEIGSGSGYGFYTRDFRLQASEDGVSNWKDIDVVSNNTSGITDRPVMPFRARYVRLYINKADSDNCARIYEFQLYNDPITAAATDFDGRSLKQDSGNSRLMDAPHNSNTIAYKAYVSGYSTGIEPECSIRTNEISHSGTSALMFSGTDNYQYQSYCYYNVFDDVNIKVTDKTVLSYWLYPQNQNARFVGVDLLFTDGTNLREYPNVVDQNGNGMHPCAGRGTVNRWNYVKCNLGQYLNGKTIKRIMVAYDQPDNIGQYRGYIDDLVINEDYSYLSKEIITDFEGENLLCKYNWLKVLGAPDYISNIAYSSGITGYTSGTQPVCSPVSNEQYKSGNSALMISGTDNSQYTATYCYFNVYDNLNWTVTDQTKLSYWINPVNSLGRYTGVDIEFTDGTTLRQTSAVDYNGTKMHPNAGRGVVGQWNYITSNIGDWCSGKVIKKIMVAYDRTASTGQFKAYIDDIFIQN